MRVSTDTAYAILVASIGGSILLAYNSYDPYKNIERYYFKEQRPSYRVLKAAYAVLLVSTIISCKYLVMQVISQK
jgi:hypothetical protein